MSQRGQAIVELAVVLPILVVLWSLGVDGARVYSTSLEIRGAARAGSLEAMLTDDSAVGNAIRAATSDYPDGPLWGADASGHAYVDCNDSDPLTRHCGDGDGCVQDSPFWHYAGTSPEICFSLGSCEVDSTTQRCVAGQPASDSVADQWACNANQALCWGQRIPSGWDDGPPLQGKEVVNVVRVCAKVTPLVLSAGGLASLWDICSDVYMTPAY